MNSRIKDITGQVFGRWTVLEFHAIGKWGQALWRCRCVCGTEHILHSGSLRSGGTRSCGCLGRERHTTHGLAKTATYKIWTGMMTRCNNPHFPAYPLYGGRGIKICERWHKYENFLADMGERPAGLTIDRFPDQDGNYEPGNCRWATAQQQAANRRERTHCKYGHEFTPENTIVRKGVNNTTRRRCKKCFDARNRENARKWRQTHLPPKKPVHSESVEVRRDKLA